VGAALKELGQGEAAIYFADADLVSYGRIDEPALYEWIG